MLQIYEGVVFYNIRIIPNNVIIVSIFFYNVSYIRDSLLSLHHL